MNLKQQLLDLNDKFRSEEMIEAKKAFEAISKKCRDAAAQGLTSITLPRAEVNNIVWELLEKEDLDVSSSGHRNEIIVEIKWG